MVVILNEDEFLSKLLKILIDQSQIQVPLLSYSEHPEWLELKQAQLILPYKSKKKWKELRDSNSIDFSIYGRQYLYNRESLLRYISRNSTLRSILQKGNGKI